MLGEYAANGIALVLHQRATNAAKYGALTRESGRVEITWTVDATNVTLNWREPQGGPIVNGTPLSAGFGSLLVRETVERSLSGTLRHVWALEGVEVTLQLPLEKLKDLADGARAPQKKRPRPNATGAWNLVAGGGLEPPTPAL